MDVEALKRDVGTLRTKLFYGFGSAAFGAKDQGFATFLLLFYNQVVGRSAATVSTAEYRIRLANHRRMALSSPKIRSRLA